MSTRLYTRITETLRIAITPTPHCCGGPACGIEDQLAEFVSHEYGHYPACERFLLNELCREVEQIHANYEQRIAALEETIVALRGQAVSDRVLATVRS